MTQADFLEWREIERKQRSRTAKKSQRYGLAAQQRIGNWLRNHYREVKPMSYGSPYDFLVCGKRVEVKACPCVEIGDQLLWAFTIQGHWKHAERNVDVYVLRLENIPGFKSAIHLIIAAPIRRSTVSISLRNLISGKYAKHFNDFSVIGPTKTRRRSAA